MTRRNLRLLPLALFVRAPLVLLGRLFITIGNAITAVGSVVPGLQRPL